MARKQKQRVLLALATRHKGLLDSTELSDLDWRVKCDWYVHR